ncbi:hypothetical protein C5Y96_20520 [Blastopirellula marina]|uniref:Uncharacterized protein n=1 Tax=Blastopirellula marina TaxID=124 RepID=A0A2S8F134_9BACT|nr:MULTISPECIES: hypothetical protein [Pirellulaceae]PQO25843.1 hypothetical protein C5Y96_20520 [Blastopirellula marina]RCS44199.1 hypothetical protein DTL36_20550 [Bremerella cremea]
MSMDRTRRSFRTGSSNNPVLIILGVVGAITVIACLGCGGCMLGVLGLGAFSDGSGLFFMEEMEVEVQRQLKDHPDVKRELGEIESVSANIFDSVEADDEFKSDDFWSFDVKGSKASGEIIVEAPGLTNESSFTQRILRTSNGEFDLGPTPDDYVPLSEAPDEEDLEPSSSLESEEPANVSGVIDGNN